MTKRFIAQFVRGGFPDQYAVADTSTLPWTRIGEPKPYHEANDEADARNSGTFGAQPTDTEAVAAFSGWFAVLPDTP